MLWRILLAAACFLLTVPAVAQFGIQSSQVADDVLAVGHGASPYITVYRRDGDTLTKLANPATLPASSAGTPGWNPDSTYLAVPHALSPFITIYERDGDTLTKITDPATLPTGRGLAASWSPDGDLLAVAHETSPYLTVYEWDGSTLTKVANPATLPTGDGNGVAWSRDGNLLAVAHETSPYVTIYQRSGTTFTKVPDPATLPTGDGNGASWSQGADYLAVGHDASPYLTIYQRSGTTYTKIADPASLPTGNATDVSWTPNGTVLAVSHVGSPHVTTYYRSGSTLTKLADPDVNPTSSGTGASWAFKGDYLAITHVLDPQVTVYEFADGQLTKIANPSTLPSGGGLGASWPESAEVIVGDDVREYTTGFRTETTTEGDVPAFQVQVFRPHAYPVVYGESVLVVHGSYIMESGLNTRQARFAVLLDGAETGCEWDATVGASQGRINDGKTIECRLPYLEPGLHELEVTATVVSNANPVIRATTSIGLRQMESVNTQGEEMEVNLTTALDQWIYLIVLGGVTVFFLARGAVLPGVMAATSTAAHFFDPPLISLPGVAMLILGSLAIHAIAVYGLFGERWRRFARGPARGDRA